MGLLNRVAKLNLYNDDITVYTVPAGKSAVLIGANVSNKIETLIKVSFKIEVGNVAHTIVKDLPIPANAAFSFSGLEQKLVLMAGDKVIFHCDTVNGGDVWLSLSELEA